jgi:hypothetical protein
MGKRGVNITLPYFASNNCLIKVDLTSKKNGGKCGLNHQKRWKKWDLTKTNEGKW